MWCYVSERVPVLGEVSEVGETPPSFPIALVSLHLVTLAVVLQAS